MLGFKLLRFGIGERSDGHHLVQTLRQFGTKNYDDAKCSLAMCEAGFMITYQIPQGPLQ